MGKISSYIKNTAITVNDYLLGNSATGPQTERFLVSDLLNFYWNLANIPSGATSPITRDNESQFPYIASGMVWSGDSYGVNRNASMTAGICYINGRRISIGSVTARTFTASKDTYVDILDNGDGTGTIVYTEVTNNAASPALAANSIRNAIIITGATTIAAATSVNQGQETMVLPIASSVPYAVTDSLGNLICPRDPNRKILGYRQIITDFSTGSGAQVQITGLSVPVIIPANRKVKVTLFTNKLQNTLAGASNSRAVIWEGAVGTTQLQNGEFTSAGSNYGATINSFRVYTPTTASLTYNASLANIGGTTAVFPAAPLTPGFLIVELV